MDLTRFPRIKFVHAPTPLEPLRNLTAALNGPQIFIKRDDCTGLASGGNKARKLEFLMAAAVAAGADTVVTHGAVQSNHVRQTAAAAAQCGLRCEALLERRLASTDDEYESSGNVFLGSLFGATLHYRETGQDMNSACEAFAEELRSAGRKVYVVPGGGSNPLGALGYVSCADEIMAQAYEQGLRIDHVVHATGSMGTQAGLVAGFAATEISLLGISVRQPQERQEAGVFALAERTAALLKTPCPISRDAVRVDDRFVGPGYGLPTEKMIQAIRLLAETEGILLDPVYTGKGMAGLIDLVLGGAFQRGDNIVFLHTGGSVGLFGYRSAFAGAGGS